MKADQREKNKSDSMKIFIGCLGAGFILFSAAVIYGLMEVYL